MTSPSFLAYVPDPFGVRASLYHLCREDGKHLDLAADKVSAHDGLIVTYDSATLVDDLRRAGMPPPSQLVDIGGALRLCAGIPRDEGGEKHWDVWAALAPHFSNSDKAKYFQAIVESRSDRPDHACIMRMLEVAAHAVQDLWFDMVKRLDTSEELLRFMTVEVPVQSIFSYRQYSGVPIDRELTETLIQRVADEKYDAYRAVASALAKNPTGLNFWNIQQHLSGTDVAHLSHIDDGGRLREAFKIAAFGSKFARDFLTYVDASRDESILQRAMGPDERLHPVFQVMGTVTGRILVSDPYLQQLRRAYRKVISADPNMRLIYLDYGQFEPGILAFLSGHQHLINAYNNGDLYTALSERVFGSTEFRSISKRMFLAFCYGMTADGIAKLVAGQAGKETEFAAYREAVEGFFSAFPALEQFRSKMQAHLAKHNFVSSQLGNRRYRTTEGNLTSKERRWALNQPVQATASLIFKEALVALADQFGMNSIMLPVHDAVLMQFESDDKFESKVRAAEVTMLEAFRRRCPGINARVSIGSFSQ